MICASCDQEIPDQGVVCRRCNHSAEPAGAGEPVSHHDLATTVRRLKGLVLVSLVFGAIVAPFALYIATRALTRYGGSSSTDPATLRQLIQLRRLAAVLLVAWAFILGGWIASLFSATAVA